MTAARSQRARNDEYENGTVIAMRSLVQTAKRNGPLGLLAWLAVLALALLVWLG